MRREGQKRKERGDRGSPDRCDTPAKIGRTAYANATVWPWWNAVKTDGANRREKASPTGLTVRQMGYFGPGSALLAYTCMRSRTRVSARAYTSGGGHGGFASRFHREQRFYSRARAARETWKNSANASPEIIFLRGPIWSKFYNAPPRKE